MKRLLRKAAERLGRRLVLRRNLPGTLGGASLYVSPDARLSYIKRDFLEADHTLLDQVRALVPSGGGKIWDIGANVGLFGFVAAGLAGPAGRVLAVEADPWLFSLLQRSRAANLARDTMAPIDLLCAAIAGEGRIARLGIATRGRAANALDGFGSSQMGGQRETIMPGQVTLDDVLQATFTPDIVKIDIEGVELEALRAAPRLLAARPLILVEVTSANARPLADLLHAADYELFDAKAPLDAIRPVDGCGWDTLAIPCEKRERLGLTIAPRSEASRPPVHA